MNKQQIKIQDTIPGAEYTNMMQVNHNKEEFQLIFANVIAPTGKTVAKLISNPVHYKKMVEALKDNLRKYEEKFGPIEIPQIESPKGGLDNWQVIPPEKGNS